MLDHIKIGNQITFLRREKGLTGEKFAELLGVSAQAVSKWENGKNLPETSILPLISKILEVSIDSLLMPKELLVLKAEYTDGVNTVDITKIVANLVLNNKLYILCTTQFLGLESFSERMGILSVKYQTPNGIFYDFAVQSNELSIDLSSGKYSINEFFKIIGAFYGNKNNFRSAMTKMEHYEYFQWSEIYVDHEKFPSFSCTDKPEYLTIVFLNSSGIHTVSCQEGETLVYSSDRTSLSVKDASSCILPNIITLEWEKGMDCTWAGAVYASLKYMNERYTYEEIMGISGACYRLAFTEVWDWSATDALVAFDYSTILFKAIGYEQIWTDRVNKENRHDERQTIIKDISNGKPVIAINLRIAPEWGVITGYSKNGEIFYCRTYFDKEYLNEYHDYLETDFWPFLIVHFGDKIDVPTDNQILFSSLKVLVDSFEAPSNRGYWQGQQAYEMWIDGLSNSSLWNKQSSNEDIERRIGVNDSTLLNLIDARRSACEYLNQSIALLEPENARLLSEIANSYNDIATQLTNFRNKLKVSNENSLKYNDIYTGKCFSDTLRCEEINLLTSICELEKQICKKAKMIIQSK